MREDYLKQVIRRGNELCILEQAAALCNPSRSTALRWVVGAALGLLATLIPSVGTAQAFCQMI